MATSFDRWEKDPFFNAAEEVQESSDRYLSFLQLGFPFVFLCLIQSLILFFQ